VGLLQCLWSWEALFDMLRRFEGGSHGALFPRPTWEPMVLRGWSEVDAWRLLVPHNAPGEPVFSIMAASWFCEKTG
jgi:hypothetical protein